jgi:hypothetical protein
MKDWRDVVYAYFQACRSDVQRHLISKLSCDEAQFLNEYGTPPVKQRYEAATTTHRDEFGQPPPQDAYEVMEESPHRVLAQVSPCDRTSPSELLIPPAPTSFLLIEDEAGWKIAGLYRPCLCNIRARGNATPRHEPGKCFFCRGKGTSLVPKIQVRGFWVFKRRTVKWGPCKHCGGTGNCQKCAGEEVPGWRNAFSVTFD